MLARQKEYRYESQRAKLRAGSRFVQMDVKCAGPDNVSGSANVEIVIRLLLSSSSDIVIIANISNMDPRAFFNPYIVPSAKAYVCPENGCDKAFARRSDLNRHYNIHMNLRLVL